MMSLLWALGPLAHADPLTAEQLDAILTFRNEHLQVRPLETVIPGTVTVMQSGWGWGPRPWRGYRWGVGMTDVVSTPPEVMHSWGVFQGPRPLTVPEYLDAVGRHDASDALDRKIHRSHDTATAFGALGLAGVAAGAAGVVGVFAGPEDMRNTFSGIGLGGLGAALVSGIVSGAGSTRAAKLAHEFPKTQALDTVHEEIRTFNEDLRTDLGLTPQQAYRELERPPRAGAHP